MCAIDAGDESAIGVDKVIFSFYEFNDACARVAADERYKVVDIAYALYAHFT
jgi:hypothetical protein